MIHVIITYCLIKHQVLIMIMKSIHLLLKKERTILIIVNIHVHLCIVIQEINHMKMKRIKTCGNINHIQVERLILLDQLMCMIILKKIILIKLYSYKGL